MKEESKELRELIEDHLNGVGSEGDFALLQQKLRASAEARRFYRRYLGVDSAIRDLGSAERILPEPSAPLDLDQLLEPNPASRPPSIIWWALAASVMLLLGYGVFWWAADRPPLQAGPSVAVLTRAIDAQWKHPKQRFEAGEALSAGRLSLASGLLQIEFFSGAIVVLQGPAEFDLVSASRGFCLEGKLRTTVPSHAHGFTIGAPGMDVVDLGTEFALAVNPGAPSQVHVIEGEVELHPSNTRATNLLAGNAVSFGAATQTTPIVASAAGFLGPAELAGLASGQSDVMRQRWAKESQQLRTRPETVAFYGFEAAEPWSRTLSNHGPIRVPALEGAIIGSEWTRGRWPGKGALEFKRITDRVRINVPGEFDSLTLSAWVRIEGWDRWLSSLLLSDGFPVGAVHWQLSDKGEMILGINAKGLENHFSPPVIGPGDLGRWVHLATVYDSVAKIVTHYLDGQAVGSTPIKNHLPLRIGAAELGNWNSLQPQKRSQVRSLNGRLDEFAIFSKAYSAKQIQEAYENGKPR